MKHKSSATKIGHHGDVQGHKVGHKGGWERGDLEELVGNSLRH